jgi:hypothetical protein
MAADSNGGEIKLTVGEDKVTTADVTKGEEIDLKNRDPENLHDHIKVCNLIMLTFYHIQIDI